MGRLSIALERLDDILRGLRTLEERVRRVEWELAEVRGDLDAIDRRARPYGDGTIGGRR